jgi:phosphoribosylaminoimidazole carboxylase PurE protein
VAKTPVAIVMGSDSDWPIMELCVKQLDELGIGCAVEIMSSHRSPELVREFARTAQDKGFEVLIAAAGLSATLAGQVAANTTLPVIGVPLASGPLQGVDALLSTVQMPPGVPVATVGIGSAGARNAALLAAQIIARHDSQVEAALRRFRDELARSVERKSQALRQRLAQEREGR